MITELYTDKDFINLERKFKIYFNDKNLLVRAFTHGSYDDRLNKNYERLEFLGDAILQFEMSKLIFNHQSDKTEGEMTRLRALLVNENSLAYIVKRNTMVDYLIVGKSILSANQEYSNSYVADIFESFVAAIYLDQGIEKARDFIKVEIFDKRDEILNQEFTKDFKTELQEILQKNGPINLKYECVLHDTTFSCEVFLDDLAIGFGEGRSKKWAQQMAAKNALSKMVNNES